MTKHQRQAMADFVTQHTMHTANVEWFYKASHVHNDEYCQKVADSVNALVAAIEAKYDVCQDKGFCCQWEGVSLQSFDQKAVDAAAQELASHLQKFKFVIGVPGTLNARDARAQGNQQ